MHKIYSSRIKTVLERDTNLFILELLSQRFNIKLEELLNHNYVYYTQGWTVKVRNKVVL